MIESLKSELDKRGVEWEVYVIKTKQISATVEGGKLKNVHSSEGERFAVRVIRDGRVGFVSGNVFSPEMVDFALKLAAFSEDEMKSLPRPEKFRRVDEIYDRRVDELISNPEGVRDEIEAISVSRGKVALASLNHSVSEVFIANSNGVEAEERSSYSSFFIEIVYDGGSGYEGDESRDANLKIDRATARAEEMAVMSSKAKKIESGYYRVALEPIAVHQLFSNSLYPSFSAENVFKGRSIVKVGNVYGSITIIDDPLLEGGLMSTSFDDEGVASKRTLLMDGGEVKGYYTDWKYAEKMGIEPTSNGYRQNASPPSPLPSNIVLEGEEGGEDRCLRVHTLIGAHTSNPVSGDFSVECMNATFDGVAIKGAMLYGNVFELLKNFAGFAGERRQVGNTFTATIVFDNVRVV